MRTIRRKRRRSRRRKRTRGRSINTNSARIISKTSSSIFKIKVVEGAHVWNT